MSNNNISLFDIVGDYEEEKPQEIKKKRNKEKTNSPDKYACEYCGKRFNCKIPLKNHYSRLNPCYIKVGKCDIHENAKKEILIYEAELNKIAIEKYKQKLSDEEVNNIKKIFAKMRKALNIIANLEGKDNLIKRRIENEKNIQELGEKIISCVNI